jgi:PAS domain S-box-containing protein
MSDQHKIASPEIEFPHSAIDHMPGFLFRCLADADNTATALTRGFERLTGYSAEDVLHNRVIAYTSLIHVDDLGALDVAIQTAIERRATWSANYRLRHRDGHYVGIRETGYGVFDAAGRLCFLEGLVAIPAPDTLHPFALVVNGDGVPLVPQADAARTETAPLSALPSWPVRLA